MRMRMRSRGISYGAAKKIAQQAARRTANSIRRRSSGLAGITKKKIMGIPVVLILAVVGFFTRDKWMPMLKKK